jgi:hypothetical protein
MNDEVIELKQYQIFDNILNLSIFVKKALKWKP